MLLGFPKSSSAKPEGRQGFHLLYQIPQIFVTCSTLPFEPQRVQSSEGTCGCARAGPGCPAPPAPPGLMVGLAPHLGKHLSCPRAIPQGNNMHTSPSLQGNRNGSSESYCKPLCSGQHSSLWMFWCFSRLSLPTHIMTHTVNR